jgi:hypothetical protein
MRTNGRRSGERLDKEKEKAKQAEQEQRMLHVQILGNTKTIIETNPISVLAA